MKAVIAIEVPEELIGTVISRIWGEKITLYGETEVVISGQGIIKPLPEKNLDCEPILAVGDTYEDGYRHGEEHGYISGRNACIDEITGGKNVLPNMRCCGIRKKK